MDQAKDFADQHDEQVDQGLEKAGEVADQRTGGGDSDQIDRGARNDRFKTKLVACRH